ncbi:hypothetical protein ADK60_01205 [Streptomyces sp. XY431]|nr:hypothetical protein ADK60_01205 [Streptomyces sp. XY431]
MCTGACIGVLARWCRAAEDGGPVYEEAGLPHTSPRVSSGHRDYPPQAAGQLIFHREVQAAGLTLGEVRWCRGSGTRASTRPGPLAEHPRTVEENPAEPIPDGAPSAPAPDLSSTPTRPQAE